MKINKKKIMMGTMLCMSISSNTISSISANTEYTQPNIDIPILNQNESEYGITLQRIDEVTRKGVSGAKYMITNPSESTVVGYIITGEDGYGSIRLPYGNYLIQEIEAPEGYENDYFILPFNINENTKEHYHILTARIKSELENNQSVKDETEIQVPKEDNTKLNNSENTDTNQREEDKVEEDAKQPNKEVDSTIVEEGVKQSDKEADNTVMENDKYKDTGGDNNQHIDKEIENNTSIDEKTNSNKQEVQIDQTKKEKKKEVANILSKEKLEKAITKKQQVENKKDTQYAEKQIRESVQTSDTSNLLLWGFASIFALCTIAFLSIKKLIKR